MSINHEQFQQTSQDDRSASNGPRRSYAATRSESSRPILSLHDFHSRHRARSLQLGWVGLSRPNLR